MAYSLSFSAKFFCGSGEPYDTTELCLNSKGQPVSLYSAILMKLNDAQWRKEVCEHFQVHPSVMNDSIAIMLIETARDNDTCSNLTVPVEVWIDKEGEFRVDVYE